MAALEREGGNLSSSPGKPQAEFITTGAVAAHCGVSKVTVLRWISKGHLAAFRLPEGHYRIHRNDFNRFLEKHGIPLRSPVSA